VQIAGPLFNGGAVAEIEIISPDGRQIAAESAAFMGSEWDIVGYFWGPKHPSAALVRAAKQISGDLEIAQASATTISPPARAPAAKPSGFGASQSGAGTSGSGQSATRSSRIVP
jgi:hypothetical protein